MRASRRGSHISGAEGLYGGREVSAAVKKYFSRAMTHPRGAPDEVRITVERLKGKALSVTSLPLCTLKCGSPREAKGIIIKSLEALGASGPAIDSAFKVLDGKKTMRGAGIISIKSGLRLEPDKAGGVRVSRLGIKKTLSGALSSRLSRLGINTDRVKEALAIASKAAFHPDVFAEVCISDDPGYTTGYIASKKSGYLRLPNIKGKGSRRAGRVFFVREGADIKSLINYLRMKPVIIGRLSALRGAVQLADVLDSPNA